MNKANFMFIRERYIYLQSMLNYYMAIEIGFASLLFSSELKCSLFIDVYYRNCFGFHKLFGTKLFNYVIKQHHSYELLVPNTCDWLRINSS